MNYGYGAEIDAMLLKDDRKKAKKLADKGKPKPVLEKDIQKEILAFLKELGIWHWRAATGGQLRWNSKKEGFLSPSSSKGCPDILGVLPGGKMLMIEVKSATGKLSPIQKEWLDSCSDLGGVAFVARSVDDVRRVFNEHPGIQDYAIYLQKVQQATPRSPGKRIKSPVRSVG